MKKQLQPLSKCIIVAVTVIISFGLTACEATLSKSVDAQEYTKLKSRVERRAESLKQISEGLKPHSEYCENLLSPLRERIEVLAEALFLAAIKDAETDNFNQSYDVLEEMLSVLDEVEVVQQECKYELQGQPEPTPHATSMQDSWQQDAADAIRTCGDIQQYMNGIYEKLSATQRTDALFDSRADLDYIWIQEGEEWIHGIEMPKEGLGWVWNYPISTTGYSDYVGYFSIENNQCAAEDHVYAPIR